MKKHELIRKLQEETPGSDGDTEVSILVRSERYPGGLVLFIQNVVPLQRWNGQPGIAGYAFEAHEGNTNLYPTEAEAEEEERLGTAFGRLAAETGGTAIGPLIPTRELLGKTPAEICVAYAEAKDRRYEEYLEKQAKEREARIMITLAEALVLFGLNDTLEGARSRVRQEDVRVSYKNPDSVDLESVCGGPEIPITLSPGQAASIYYRWPKRDYVRFDYEALKLKIAAAEDQGGGE